MKRKEIESRLKDIVMRVKSFIESSPVPAFLSGLGVGIILGLFYRSLIPLVVVIALVVGGIWMFSEKD